MLLVICYGVALLIGSELKINFAASYLNEQNNTNKQRPTVERNTNQHIPQERDKRKNPSERRGQ